MFICARPASLHSDTCSYMQVCNFRLKILDYFFYLEIPSMYFTEKMFHSPFGMYKHVYSLPSYVIFVLVWIFAEEAYT